VSRGEVDDATTVAVLDGIAEGARHTVLLREELQRHGYVVTDDPAGADVVLAHSAGAFLVPVGARSQLLVLIDPPYWPGRSMIVRSAQKVVRDVGARAQDGLLWRWPAKTWWNLVYLFDDLPRVGTVVRAIRDDSLPDIIAAAGHVVIIRNDRDAWCAPDIDHLVGGGHVDVHHLPGDHDDCLHHPAPYVDVVDDVVARLARRPRR
jgi:hypothetical protein